MSKKKVEGNFIAEYDLLELFTFLTWGSGYDIQIDLQIKKTDERGKTEFAITLYDPRCEENFWIDTFTTLVEAKIFAQKYLHCIAVKRTLKSGEKIISLEPVDAIHKVEA